MAFNSRALGSSAHLRAFGVVALTLALGAIGGAGALADGPPTPPAPGQPVAAPGDKFLGEAVKKLYLGKGQQSDQVILFPVYVTEPPAGLEVISLVTGAQMLVREPEVRPGGEIVNVANPGPQPALLLGGTLLEGGKRDRMVRRDTLIGAFGAADVEVLMASVAADARKEATPFKLLDFLAPPYLRDEAMFSTSKSLAPRFVSHFLDFRGDKEKRRSLAAIGDSAELAQYCIVCQRSMAEWPIGQGPVYVIGGIAVVRGRVQTFDLFGTNDQVKAWFGPLLKSLSFPAAAIQLKAEDSAWSSPAAITRRQRSWPPARPPTRCSRTSPPPRSPCSNSRRERWARPGT